MEKFIKETPGGKNASANQGSGADNRNIGDSLREIQVGMKIVPNYDQHSFLLKRMQYCPIIEESDAKFYFGKKDHH